MSRAGKLVTILRGTETQEEIRAGRPCLWSSLKVSKLFLRVMWPLRRGPRVLCFRRPHSNPLSQLTFTLVLTGFPSKIPSEGRLSWQKVVVGVQNSCLAGCLISGPSKSSGKINPHACLWQPSLDRTGALWFATVPTAPYCLTPPCFTNW